MKIRILVTLAFCSLWSGILWSDTIHPNVVQNGGFENGFRNWAQTGNTNWNWIAGGSDGHGYNMQHSGNWGAGLGASPGTLSQTLDTSGTLPGGTYTVDFWLQNQLWGGSPDD